MPNITLAIDQKLLRQGRDYAKVQGLSLNKLIRRLLEKNIQKQETNWLDDCFKLMDETHANSHGQRWTRDELYRT